MARGVWVATAAGSAAGVRISYVRTSTLRQSLDTQLAALAEAGASRVFSEKVSTRAARRPELDRALALAAEPRSSGVAVTLVVHEHKRLGRGIGLEFLTGEPAGSHDPTGIVFTVLAAMSGSEREYIRDRSMEGHETARAAVTGPAMLSMALHLRAIAAQPVITKGTKRGQRPSPAAVMRTLRDHDARTWQS